MFEIQVPVVAAFVAGILSFLSPCVLPLVPAYISFMSGVSLDDLNHGERRKVIPKTILTAVIFILGFSLIFILLGATATAAGKFLQSRLVVIKYLDIFIMFIEPPFHLGAAVEGYRAIPSEITTAGARYHIDFLAIFTRIAGIIVILFGLHFLGIFKKALQFLNYEKRFHIKNIKPGMGSAFVIGLAFSFGWTPCISPILTSILILASTQETVWNGVFLLGVYSLGLGMPFLLTAIATQTLLDVFDKIKRHFRELEIFNGVILVLIGILMFTGKFSILAAKLSQWFPWMTQLG